MGCVQGTVCFSSSLEGSGYSKVVVEIQSIVSVLWGALNAKRRSFFFFPLKDNMALNAEQKKKQKTPESQIYYQTSFWSWAGHLSSLGLNLSCTNIAWSI